MKFMEILKEMVKHPFPKKNVIVKNSEGENINIDCEYIFQTTKQKMTVY